MDTSIPPLEPVATAAPAVRLVPVVALLVLLALGSTTIGCEMVRGPQQDDPSVVVPVSPVAAPSSTPTPSATPGAVPTPSPEVAGVDLTWTAAPVTASMRNAEMLAVAVGHDLYVAVGCTGLDKSSTTGAAWTSPDGEIWTSVNVRNAKRACLYGVISSPDGYLAWGHDADGAAFWRSEDGDQWSRARSLASFANQHVADVVRFGDQYIAFSAWGPEEPEPKPRIWASPNGVRWSDQPDSIGCDGGQTSDPESLPYIRSVFVDGIEIVAIGVTLTEYHGPVAGSDPATGGELRVMGRSQDARCWTVTYTPTDSSTWQSVLTPDGIVGVGHQATNGATVPLITASTSVDGSAWSPSTFSPGALEGTLERLASGDRGLLAIGPVRSGEPIEDLGDAYEPPEDLPPRGTDPSAWWSADGRTWRRTAAPDAPTTLFSDLVAIPGGFMAVGRKTTPSGWVAEVWIAR